MKQLTKERLGCDDHNYVIHICSDPGLPYCHFSDEAESFYCDSSEW